MTHDELKQALNDIRKQQEADYRALRDLDLAAALVAERLPEHSAVIKAGAELTRARDAYAAAQAATPEEQAYKAARDAYIRTYGHPGPPTETP